MIKAVFLDFDETIFDHKHSSQEGLRAVGEKHPILLEPKMEWLEDRFWELHDWNYDRVLSKKITTDEARIERLEKLFEIIGAKPPVEELPELGQIYKKKYGDAARAIPGIPELVKKLKEKGYFTGVITNGLTEFQKKRLEGLGLKPYFDVLIASEAVGSEKPKPEIFQVALKEAGCKPTEALMIGDAWEKDIVGAINAGMEAIWLKRRDAAVPGADISETDLPGASIADSVEDLERILREKGIL